jgi:thioredoxin-like negative regulator of GroEL
VHSIPTLVLFKDGVEKERMVGAQSRQALQALLDKHLA